MVCWGGRGGGWAAAAAVGRLIVSFALPAGLLITSLILVPIAMAPSCSPKLPLISAPLIETSWSPTVMPRLRSAWPSLAIASTLYSLSMVSPSPIGVRTSSTAVDVGSAALVIVGMTSLDMSMLPPERCCSWSVTTSAVPFDLLCRIHQHSKHDDNNNNTAATAPPVSSSLLNADVRSIIVGGDGDGSGSSAAAAGGGEVAASGEGVGSGAEGEGGGSGGEGGGGEGCGCAGGEPGGKRGSATVTASVAASRPVSWATWLATSAGVGSEAACCRPCCLCCPCCPCCATSPTSSTVASTCSSASDTSSMPLLGPRDSGSGAVRLSSPTSSRSTRNSASSATSAIARPTAWLPRVTLQPGDVFRHSACRVVAAAEALTSVRTTTIQSCLTTMRATSSSFSSDRAVRLTTTCCAATDASWGSCTVTLTENESGEEGGGGGGEGEGQGGAEGSNSNCVAGGEGDGGDSNGEGGGGGGGGGGEGVDKSSGHTEQS